MKVLAHDKFIKEANIKIDFFNGDNISFKVNTQDIKTVLSKSNFITLHLPKIGEKAIIGAEEIGLMKTGARLLIHQAEGSLTKQP